MPTYLNAHDERDKSAHGERAPLLALVIAVTKNAVHHRNVASLAVASRPFMTTGRNS